MERLTIKGFNFTTDFIKRDIDSWSIAQAMNKLQKYEDLEEQGLLLKLPCKVGDTVYRLSKIASGHWEEDKYIIDDYGEWKIYKKTFSLLHICEIGKTVFLTQSEAEEALKRMERGKNEQSITNLV